MSARRHSSSFPRLRPYSQPTAPRPSGSTASDFDRVSVHFRRFPVHSKPIPPPECTENYLPVHFPGGTVQSVTQLGDTAWRGLWPTIRIFPVRHQFLDQPVHLPPGEPGDAPHIGVRERLPGALGSPPDHPFDSRPRRLPLAGRHGASAPRRRQPRQGSEFERPPGLVVPAPFQIAVVLLHDDDASGPFRHLDLFDDRRQLGIRAVVHRALQPIQVHLGRHSAYGPSASQDSFGHAEHHRSAPAVRHADRPLDRRTETPLPVTAPLFESQILILQVVRHAMVESLEEFLDLRNRSQNSLPSPRPADREPTARIVGGASRRAGQGEAKFGTPHRFRGQRAGEASRLGELERTVFPAHAGRGRDLERGPAPPTPGDRHAKTEQRRGPAVIEPCKQHFDPIYHDFYH